MCGWCLRLTAHQRWARGLRGRVCQAPRLGSRARWRGGVEALFLLLARLTGQLRRPGIRPRPPAPTPQYSDIQKWAIELLGEAGILLVASAGNDAADLAALPAAQRTYPASLSTLLVRLLAPLAACARAWRAAPRLPAQCWLSPLLTARRSPALALH